ncbi:hypothetical protein NQD34_000526 [Periophthalmus magnuspinnatus]|nr:hypothetical protein NQD34_000526 [Periophthalmus magnuspinnatus]
MAFCNLFTNLGGEGELKDPNHRNNTNNGQEGSSKRKPQTMKSGPYAKRQCPQPYTAATCDAVQNEEPKTHGFNRANNNNPRPGVSRNATYRHNPRTFMSDDVNRGSANNTTNKKKKKMKNKGKKKRERERGKMGKGTGMLRKIREIKTIHSLINRSCPKSSRSNTLWRWMGICFVFISFVGDASRVKTANLSILRDTMV